MARTRVTDWRHSICAIASIFRISYVFILLARTTSLLCRESVEGRHRRPTEFEFLFGWTLRRSPRGFRINQYKITLAAWNFKNFTYPPLRVPLDDADRTARIFDRAWTTRGMRIRNNAGIDEVLDKCKYIF